MTSELQTRFETLNSKWHTALANAMGIQVTENFQIVQGDLSVSSDSSTLFLISDSTPSNNLAGYYTADFSNKISSAYGNLLVSLLPYEGDEICSNPLNKALDSYHNNSNQMIFYKSDKTPYSLYKYSLTIDEAKEAISKGKTISDFSFDSTIDEIDINHSKNSLSTSAIWDAFAVIIDVDFESIIAKFLESKITVNANFDKYAKVPTTPLEWYDKNLTSRAFENKDDPSVWDLKAQQSWDDFFKQPNGELVRHVNQLLFVSGYEITVKFHATFSKEEFNLFIAKATFTLWPFFSASLSINHKTDFSLGDDGTFSYTIKSNPENLKVLGITYE